MSTLNKRYNELEIVSSYNGKHPEETLPTEVNVNVGTVPMYLDTVEEDER